MFTLVRAYEYSPATGNWSRARKLTSMNIGGAFDHFTDFKLVVRDEENNLYVAKKMALEPYFDKEDRLKNISTWVSELEVFPHDDDLPLSLEDAPAMEVVRQSLSGISTHYHGDEAKDILIKCHGTNYRWTDDYVMQNCLISVNGYISAPHRINDELILKGMGDTLNKVVGSDVAVIDFEELDGINCRMMNGDFHIKGVNQLEKSKKVIIESLEDEEMWKDKTPFAIVAGRLMFGKRVQYISQNLVSIELEKASEEDIEWIGAINSTGLYRLTEVIGHTGEGIQYRHYREPKGFIIDENDRLRHYLNKGVGLGNASLIIPKLAPTEPVMTMRTFDIFKF
jgi:hypothetical protein